MLSLFIGFPDKSKEGKEGGGANDAQLLASSTKPKTKVGSVIYTSCHSRGGIDTKARSCSGYWGNYWTRLACGSFPLVAWCHVCARVYFQIIYLQSVVIGAFKVLWKSTSSPGKSWQESSLTKTLKWKIMLHENKLSAFKCIILFWKRQQVDYIYLHPHKNR